MQRHVQQGIVKLQCPVVRDETELAELVHELAHARPRGADHLCKWLVLQVWIAGITGSVRLSEQFYTDSDV